MTLKSRNRLHFTLLNHRGSNFRRTHLSTYSTCWSNPIMRFVRNLWTLSICFLSTVLRLLNRRAQYSSSGRIHVLYIANLASW
uniref:Uncharacterized protein n=1 Tax=Trichobilharzia regenti TaxID=157069 RepID=A0AA85ISW0_TRIRE